MLADALLISVQYERAASAIVDAMGVLGVEDATGASGSEDTTGASGSAETSGSMADHWS